MVSSYVWQGSMNRHCVAHKPGIYCVPRRWFIVYLFGIFILIYKYNPPMSRCVCASWACMCAAHEPDWLDDCERIFESYGQGGAARFGSAYCSWYCVYCIYMWTRQAGAPEISICIRIYARALWTQRDPPVRDCCSPVTQKETELLSVQITTKRRYMGYGVVQCAVHTVVSYLPSQTSNFKYCLHALIHARKKCINTDAAEHI